MEADVNPSWLIAGRRFSPVPLRPPPPEADVQVRGGRDDVNDACQISGSIPLNFSGSGRSTTIQRVSGIRSLGCTGRTCKPVSGCAGKSSSRVKCSVNEPLAVDEAALVLGLHENAELVCRHGRVVRLVQSRTTLARAGPRARSPVTRATAGWRPLTLTASDAVCTSGLSPVTSTAGHASDEDRGSASQNIGSERRRRQDGRRALDGLEVDVNKGQRGDIIVPHGLPSPLGGCEVYLSSGEETQRESAPCLLLSNPCARVTADGKGHLLGRSAKREGRKRRWWLEGKERLPAGSCRAGRSRLCFLGLLGRLLSLFRCGRPLGLFRDGLGGVVGPGFGKPDRQLDRLLRLRGRD